VGREGIALASGLTPSGVVRVESEEWKAVSGEGTIMGGAKVRVTGIDGFVLTVEPASAEHVAAGAVPPAASTSSTQQREGGTT